MRRSRIFLALTIVFAIGLGISLAKTIVSGNTMLRMISMPLTAVLAWISLLLAAIWDSAEDDFEAIFVVKPPRLIWGEARNSSQQEKVIQCIVGKELRRRATALEGALRQRKKIELEFGGWLEVEPILPGGTATVEQTAEALIAFSKARREAGKEEANYNKAAKLARRFCLRICRSYRDYLHDGQQLSAELIPGGSVMGSRS